MNTDHANSDLAEGIWESAQATRSTIAPDSMSECLFFEHAHRHRLPARAADNWASDAAEISVAGAEALVETRIGPVASALLLVEGCLVHARVVRGRANVSVAGTSLRDCERVLDQFREALPAPRIPEREPRIAVTFSWRADRGAAWNLRVLDVTRWSEVEANYPRATREPLARLMRNFRPNRSGQTLVWHGAPGTGKTSALRALAWEWREWCDVCIVTDPDQLFDRDAGYLMETITESLGPGGSGERYRLLVLEDSGELLTGDARRLVGHGLSRYLNVCDGLLGQAQKVLLLVTTNEPMQRLHPAVRRAGRCAAEIEFQPFDRRGANRWLAQRCETRVTGGRVLADLWAIAEGRDIAAREAMEPIGFARVLGGEE